VETAIIETATQTPDRKLEIRNLQKSTKTALVMDEINITVHAGEIFALVGGPASCKTLLSKIVVNLVKKTGGDVLVDGITNKKFKLSAKKIGVSLEQQKFYPDQTPYKLLGQYAMLNKRILSHKRVVNTLNLVGLKDVMHNTLNRFDASKTARLKIALAVYGDPEILILDDPFRNLSAEESFRIRTILKTVAAEKQTAVFVTAKQVTDVEEICDTIGIIDDGFLVTVKSYNQFMKDDAPYETMRVQTPTPNYAAKIIEENLHFKTHLCGEWVVVDTKPANAQSVADVLVAGGIKILSVQRVNRSLSEQFYEIISARRNRQLYGGVQ
jgi:ABC-2 type transport system ATP-binding protein